MRARSWLCFVVVSLCVSACGGGNNGGGPGPIDAPPGGADAGVPDAVVPDAPGTANQVPVLELLAGSVGGPGNADGTGATARFGEPTAAAFDGAGNLYITDFINHTIRRATPGGAVTTLAGTAGASGSADGTGAAARFSGPSGIAVDSAGNVYVADLGNHTIRKITPDGAVTTFAGTAGARGNLDGVGAAAQFSFPLGLAVDHADNLYVADFANNEIRRITPAGEVTTFAGGAESGSNDGTTTDARFFEPEGVAIDPAGNVFVADSENHTIREITPDGLVSTLAGLPGVPGSADGTGHDARFNLPGRIAVDGAGNVYVPDTSNHTIRQVTAAGVVTTVAGRAGAIGSADGTGAAARFVGPSGVAIDGAGALFVNDESAIRKLTPDGAVTTFAGTAAEIGSTDGAGPDARFGDLGGLAVDSAGNTYVADTSNNTIRRIDVKATVATVAGTAGAFGSQDGTGTAARFDTPASVTVDGAGNVFIADFGNSTIRKLSTAGLVTTYAGVPGVFGSGDGAAGHFNGPNGLASDAAGNLFVTDFANETIRMIATTHRISTVAGTVGRFGSTDGAGGAALFSDPGGIAIDATGNLFVADTGNATVRKIAPAGVTTTLAGTAGVLGSADGTGAAASFLAPTGIAVDGAGNAYVADPASATIRRITPTGATTTLAGTAGVTGIVLGTTPQLAAPSGLAILGDSLVIGDGHAVLILRHVVR